MLSFGPGQTNRVFRIPIINDTKREFDETIHVILDNEQHDSTGGQQTVSGTTHFAAVAAACNYRRAIATDNPADLPSIVRDARASEGPTLLHIKIRPGSPAELGRPTVEPFEVKGRFMQFLRNQQ